MRAAIKYAINQHMRNNKQNAWKNSLVVAKCAREIDAMDKYTLLPREMRINFQLCNGLF